MRGGGGLALLGGGGLHERRTEVFLDHSLPSARRELVTHLLPGLVPSEVSLIASLRFTRDHLDDFTGGVIWRQLWKFRSRSPVCLSRLCSSEN